MAKQQKYHSTFFCRDKKDMCNFYARIDFWVSFLALVLIVLSLTLPRYDDTTYAQAWKLTAGNWALILCGIVSIVAMVYIFVVNFCFKNNALLSGINIAVGLLMAVLFIVEYIVLTRVGAYTEDGVTYTMGNSAGVGFYLGLVGAILTVGLEFYKLGVQGYYTGEDAEKEKSGVEVVDGVVIIDGEAVQASREINSADGSIVPETEQVQDIGESSNSESIETQKEDVFATNESEDVDAVQDSDEAKNATVTKSSAKKSSGAKSTTASTTAKKSSGSKTSVTNKSAKSTTAKKSASTKTSGTKKSASTKSSSKTKSTGTKSKTSANKK